MSIGLQVGLALASVATLLGLMAVIRWQAGTLGLGAEVQRKLVHVATGCYAMALPWLFPDRWPVYMLVGAALLAMLALRLPRLSRGLGSALHGVERRSYGDFLLAISVGLCFFLAEGDTLAYLLPMAVLTLADAAAALAGTTYGRKRFQIEDGHKSVEGSVVFFTVTLLLAIILMMFLTALPPANILALALIVAAFGTLVEAQSWRGFDNLFLPVGLLIFLTMHRDSSLMTLLWLVGLVLLALVGFRLVGQRVGLTHHASSVYVIAMVLILTVVAPQNAVLPAMVLATHAWASLRAPSLDRHDQLDIIAALALFSFGWLVLGNAAGWTAISFYGLTAMGLAMGLGATALSGRPLPAVALGLGLLALRDGLMRLNPAPAQWAEPLWGLAAGCLCLVGGAVWMRPEAFRRNRTFKLTLLALGLPLAGYGVRVAAQLAAVAD